MSASAQSNAITVPRNLGQLVDESQTAAQGWVASVAVEPHGQLKNLMTVVVTFQVEESLKGGVPKIYTFSQAVILIKPNLYGLTSPAGMEQGRFRIEARTDGKLVATNGVANTGLFRGLDSQLQTRGVLVTPEVQTMATKSGAGPVPLEQLKSLIRTIAAADSKK